MTWPRSSACISNVHFYKVVGFLRSGPKYP